MWASSYASLPSPSTVHCAHTFAPSGSATKVEAQVYVVTSRENTPRVPLAAIAIVNYRIIINPTADMDNGLAKVAPHFVCQDRGSRETDPSVVSSFIAKALVTNLTSPLDTRRIRLNHLQFLSTAPYSKL